MIFYDTCYVQVMILSYHTDLIILKYIMYIDVFQYDIFEPIHGK